MPHPLFRPGCGTCGCDPRCILLEAEFSWASNWAPTATWGTARAKGGASSDWKLFQMVSWGYPKSSKSLSHFSIETTMVTRGSLRKLNSDVRHSATVIPCDHPPDGTLAPPCWLPRRHELMGHSPSVTSVARTGCPRGALRLHGFRACLESKHLGDVALCNSP